MPLHYSRRTLFASSMLELLSAIFLKPFMRKVAPSTVRRILLVEPFGMGDVLSLSVMLDPLKKKYPESEIRLLTKRGNERIYARDPRVGTVYTMPVPWTKISGRKRGSPAEWHEIWKTCRAIAAWDPDVGLDSRGDIRSQILMVLSGCRRRVGFRNYLNTNLNVHGWLLTDVVEKPDKLNRYVMNCRLIEQGLHTNPLQVEFPSFKPDIPAERLMDGSVQVIMHVGARWKYRQWPVEYWSELARRILAENIPVAAVGAREEEPVVKQIAGSVDGLISVCADMDRLIGLIRGVDLLICLDSGPMHLAQTLGVPVVVLFGPGDFELWHPLGMQNETLFHRLPCNPCLQKICVRPEDSCMPKITIEEVFEAIQRALAHKPEGFGV